MSITLSDKIRQTNWWAKAINCKDRHHDEESGIMLSDHLNAVACLIDKIFSNTKSLFISDLLSLLKIFQLDKQKMQQELHIVALLHDIGKTADDKTTLIEHPLTGKKVAKRHPVVGVRAAIDILGPETILSDIDKIRIYHLIDEHDNSYSLYRQFRKTGIEPKFKSWENLNNKIDNRKGVGIFYLLIFKLADVDGHESVEDVIWFFETVKSNYFGPLGISLPMPNENDIR